MCKVCAYLLLCFCCACARVGEDNTAANAIGAIQQIHQAEVEYLSRFGHYGDLQELGPASADLISQELTAGKIEGYQLSLTRTKTSYTITARPLNPDLPSFSSDETLSMTYR
jgi:hypothetical protein